MKTFIFSLMILTSGLFYAQNNPDLIGENNYGNLLHASYHPSQENVLVANTASTHLVKSEDNGGSWQILHGREDGKMEKLRWLNNNTLSFSVSSSFTLSDNGINIFDYDSEEVTTHIELPNSQDANYVNSYDVYSANANYILVQNAIQQGNTSQKVVYYSEDGGENWTMVYDSDNNNDQGVNNVKFSPDDPQTFFIAKGLSPNDNEGGLLITHDGGGSFSEKLTGITVNAISFNPNNPDEIITGTSISFSDLDETLYMSEDGGETWEGQGINWTDKTLDNIVDIEYDPANLDNIWVTEENEIASSTDGGETWSSQVYDDDTYYYGAKISFNPFDGQQFVITDDYSPIFTTDYGQTLNYKLNPAYPVFSVSLHKAANDPYLYYGARGGYFVKNTETGETNSYEIAPKDEFNVIEQKLKADRYTPNRVFSFAPAGFSGSALNVSNDNGQTKTEVFSTANDKLGFIKANPGNPNHYLMTTENFSESTMQRANLSDPENPQSEMVSLPGSDHVNGLEFDPVNTNTVFMAQGSEIYKSDDNGETWSSIPSPDASISTVSALTFDFYASDAGSRMVVATDQGIYATMDEGDNWTQIFDQFVDVLRFPHAMSPLVFAAKVKDNTHAFKLFYSTDQGENWTQVSNDDLKHVAAYSRNKIDFDFSPEGSDVYFATGDLGLVKYHVDDASLGFTPIKGQSKKLVVYPNPVKNTIQISNPSKSHVKQMVLYNLQGERIGSGPIAENQMDVSSLSVGVYLLNVQLQNGQTEVHRIIKR